MLASPWWIVLVLVLAVLPAALGLALARARALRRMSDIESEILPSDTCLACGERQVELVAPEVVRCLICGFVGGQGIAAWQQRRHADAIQRLPRVDRHFHAREKLVMARIQLVAADALLERALSASRFDMAGFSFDRGREKQSLWAEALSELEKARALGDEAAALVEGVLPMQAREPALSPLLLALDTSWFSDGLVVDAAVHARIKHTRAAVEPLRLAIEQQLLRLDPSLVDAEKRPTHD